MRTLLRIFAIAVLTSSAIVTGVTFYALHVADQVTTEGIGK